MAIHQVAKSFLMSRFFIATKPKFQHKMQAESSPIWQPTRRDGVMIRAFASQSVDLGFISLVESYQKTFKKIFTAFLLGSRHLGEVVKNKPASSIVVS